MQPDVEPGSSAGLAVAWGEVPVSRVTFTVPRECHCVKHYVLTDDLFLTLDGLLSVGFLIVEVI